MPIKTVRGIEDCDTGELYNIEPPLATPDVKGGIYANKKTTETNEVLIGDDGKLYSAAPDESLSKKGRYADAKMVGDKLSAIKQFDPRKLILTLDAETGELNLIYDDFLISAVKVSVAPDNTPVVGSVSEGMAISLLNLDDDTYTLRYEDSSNKALTDWGDICTLGNGESYSSLITNNIATFICSRIGVYNSSGERVGKIELDNLKPSFDERKYRFGWVSDSHLGCTSSALAPEDLTRAYKFFNDKESVDFVVMGGDITHSGTESQFSQYKSIADNYMPDKEIYCVPANHDQVTPDNYTGLWKKYTGCDKNYEVTIHGDHFLFLGSSTTSATNPLIQDDIDWIECKLEQYRNERCFVIFHYFFSDYSGNYGKHYGYAMQGSNYTLMKSILLKYPNAIWFSGHSHWDWKYQSDEKNANIQRVGDNKAWTVHVPSCAYPRQWINGAVSDVNEGSQCAIVDVYDDYVDVRGISYDGTSYKYVPLAQYRLQTSPLQIVSSSSRTVTNNLSHIQNSSTILNIFEGKSYTAKLTADPGYEIGTVTVTMGGINVTSSSYNSSTGDISISSVNGDIVITAKSTKVAEVFVVTNNLTNATSSNTSTAVTENSSYNTTISPKYGYVIDRINVSMGNIDITSQSVSGNKISIPKVSGDIKIVVTTTTLSYLYLLDLYDLDWDVSSYQSQSCVAANASIVNSDTLHVTAAGGGRIGIIQLSEPVPSNLSIMAKWDGITCTDSDATRIGIEIWLRNGESILASDISYDDFSVEKTLAAANSLSSQVDNIVVLAKIGSNTSATFPLDITFDNFRIYTDSVIGNDVPYQVFNVEQKLTNVTSTNTATKTAKGKPFTTTLTSNNGGNLSVAVSMNDIIITNEVYNPETRTITISNVTHDIEIIAIENGTALLDTSETFSYLMGSLNADGTDKTSASSYRVDEYVPVDISTYTYSLDFKITGFTYIRYCAYDDEHNCLYNSTETTSASNAIRELELPDGTTCIRFKFTPPSTAALDNVTLIGTVK